MTALVAENEDLASYVARLEEAIMADDDDDDDGSDLDDGVALGDDDATSSPRSSSSSASPAEVAERLPPVVSQKWLTRAMEPTTPSSGGRDGHVDASAAPDR